MGKVLFSQVSVCSQEGYLARFQSQTGGYPQPLMGGIPRSFLTGGYPILPERGYPHQNAKHAMKVENFFSTPHEEGCDSDGGTLISGEGYHLLGWMGVPPVGLDRGTPHWAQWGTP